MTGIQYNPGQTTRVSQMHTLLSRFTPDFLTMEELSDQDDLCQAVVDHGYGIVRGNEHPGQAATAVFHKLRDVLLLEPFRVPLTTEQVELGRGTGPDKGKAKDLKGGLYMHKSSERHIKVGVLHPYAGQKWGKSPNLRARISRDHIERPAAIAMQRDFGGLMMIGQDGNAEPEKPLYDPLRRAGWVGNHDALGELTTHKPGSWSPDCWWVLDRTLRPQQTIRPRIKFVDHQVVQPKVEDVDHRALVVRMQLRVRGT